MTLDGRVFRAAPAGRVLDVSEAVRRPLLTVLIVRFTAVKWQFHFLPELLAHSCALSFLLTSYHHKGSDFHTTV
jgi:hypothetical protein